MDFDRKFDKEIEQLLNGMTSSTNVLPFNQNFAYGLSLSALVPDRIKEKIWDKKYVEMAQLYQIQTCGEFKNDFLSIYLIKGHLLWFKNSRSKLKGKSLQSTNGLQPLIAIWIFMFKSFPMKRQLFCHI